MPKAPHWQVAASRQVEQEDGSVRLECEVRRNGVHVGTMVLKGSVGMVKASDLQAWWFPNGEGG